MIPADGPAANAPPGQAQDADLYADKGLFAKPSWRTRKTKLAGDDGPGEFALGAADAHDDQGPPPRHKPSVVEGGLFGAGNLKGDSNKERVAGGLFDYSDDEKELEMQRKESNLDDLLGGGKAKIGAAAANRNK